MIFIQYCLLRVSGIEHMAAIYWVVSRNFKTEIKMFITEAVNNNNYTKSAEENMYAKMTLFLQWMNDKL